MSAFMHTIKEHVGGEVAVLLADAAHIGEARARTRARARKPILHSRCVYFLTTPKYSRSRGKNSKQKLKTTLISVQFHVILTNGSNQKERMINFLRDSFNYLVYAKQVTVDAIVQIKTGSGLVILNSTGQSTGAVHTVGVCHCLAQEILCNFAPKATERSAIVTTVQMLCTSSEGVYLDICPTKVVEEYVVNVSSILLTVATTAFVSSLVFGGLLLVASRYVVNANHDHPPPVTAPAA